ncbi:Hsp20 family protein [Neobacillus niacini]|uniref:Hsp20/alpha crystallin family protein n=1 Tax=Neobacillus niacini TaxID=86668 RepID=UPI0007ABF2CA|nr:Hsp20 family protein [Neobacillus niacini]MEC1523498.1 Hsp20 family protein [Neobacillus niacini]
MDIEKIRQWLEITNEYRKSDFWSSVLSEKAPKEFFSRVNRHEPRYDVYRNQTTVCLLIELPGIRLDQISLNLILNKQISIKTKVNPPISNELAIMQQRHYGEVELEIDLPEPTEAHLLTVQYQDGLLYIHYPRQIQNININP